MPIEHSNIFYKYLKEKSLQLLCFLKCLNDSIRNRLSLTLYCSVQLNIIRNIYIKYVNMYCIGNIVLYNCFTKAYRQLHICMIMYHKIVGNNLQ